MKTVLISGLLAFMMSVAQTAHAQTANDVVSKYIAAMGGKEKLASLKTVKMEGSISVQGTDIGMRITKKHLTGMRMDISVMGTENYEFETPEKGTVFLPMQGMSEPTPMPEDQVKSSLLKMDLEGAFVNAKAKGNTVGLLSKEDVDGEECYKLNVTLRNGAKIDYYISTNTSYIVKTSGKRSINGVEVDDVTTYDNFKKNADGFLFPYSITDARTTVDFTEIDANVPVEESIFNQ